jgi:hypothetical protein
MEIERLSFGQSHADKIRAAHYKWANTPPGIPPDMAIEFMARLKAGGTVRKLTGGGKLGTHMVSHDRFKRHCELNPTWGAEARSISDANGRFLKAARVRGLTHCKHGHPLSGDNLYLAPGRNERKCLTCVKRRYDAPVPATAEQIQQLTAALNAGKKTISQICWGKRDGRITENPILSFRKLKHYRRLNPDFERFLRSATADNNLKGQRRRYQPERVRIEIVRSQNREFKTIVDMTPAYLPPDVRNDIAQAIFLALFEGSLRRDQVKPRVQKFVAEHNRIVSDKVRQIR